MKIKAVLFDLDGTLLPMDQDLFLKSYFKGIGKKLFCETEKIAKENGAKRLDLTVWEFNKDAISFYKSLGMQPQRYTFEKNL